MEKEINLAEDHVNISNVLARKKMKSDLAESKVNVMAIKKAESDGFDLEATDSKGKKYTYYAVSFTTNEMRHALTPDDTEGKPSGSFYNRLRSLAIRMAQRLVILTDSEGQFSVQHFYHSVDYKNGKFTVAFENVMLPYVRNEIKKIGYTQMDFPILWSFESNGAFQLYSHLKSELFHIKSYPNHTSTQEDLETYPVRFGVSELRVALGFVSLEDNDQVYEEASKSHPKWEKLEKAQKKPKYKRYGDFKNKVILPSIEEINSRSDLYIDHIYEDKVGKGGKVEYITFYIANNLNYIRTHVWTKAPEDKDDFIPNKDILKVQSLNPFANLSYEEAKLILQTGKGDIERINQAIEYTSKQPNIDNFVGYVLSLLKKGDDFITENKSTVFGSTEGSDAMKSMKESIHEPNGEIAQKVWEKNKTKPEFAEFIKYLEDQGVTLEMYELTFSLSERNREFVNWKKEHNSIL